MSNVGLHVGLKALLTAQSALDTIGHNISNANTPGYSRQSLQVSASRPLLLRGLVVGNGVQTDTITRTVDDLLGRRIVSQVSSMKRYESSLSGMTRVEALLGEPGGSGLGGILDEVFARFSDLSADPQSLVQRTGVVQSLSKLTSQFHELTNDLDQIAEDSKERIGYTANQINTLAEKIASLNQEIGKIETSGEVANDLRDQRDQVLRDLAEQIDITYHEGENGSIRVFLDGQLLVGSKDSSHVRMQTGSDGEIQLWLAGSTEPIQPKGGQVGGLLTLLDGFVPELKAKIDAFARNLVLESNRVHSTGIPSSGGFERLVGTVPVSDTDGDGSLTDQLLNASGLDFPVQDGVLYVNVRSKSTDEFETHRIEIDEGRTTVGDLLGELNSITGLNASLDSFGRFLLYAGGDKTFDFGKRLQPEPDREGAFGGTAASIASDASGPFALSSGDTLDLQGPTSSFTITFDAADFEDISQATAEELAEVINADPDTAANGMRALAVGGRLVLQSSSGGASQSFQLQGGSALASLGWSAPAVVSGQDTGVMVRAGGSYTGAANERFYFTPTADGRIGTTDGLQIEVRSEAGELVTTLDVGSNYIPGTELEVADGLHVSFSGGDVSTSDHDFFALDAIQDGDTSDVLVALGLNGLLEGTDAESISLGRAIEADPDMLATSGSGAAGDNGAVLAMIEIQHADIDELGTTFGSYYGGMVGQVGFDISSTSSSLDVEQFLVDNLESRRQQTSGVNVDEELVQMIQYEQAFGAAAQYIQVVNSLGDELLSLI